MRAAGRRGRRRVVAATAALVCTGRRFLAATAALARARRRFRGLGAGRCWRRVVNTGAESLLGLRQARDLSHLVAAAVRPDTSNLA